MNIFTKKMNNDFFDLLYDYAFAVISVGATAIGIDSIPESQTIIQVITTPAQETGIDVTQKIMTILSLFVGTIAGLIPIVKNIKLLFRNKK